jgi:hypothetical protein
LPFAKITDVKYKYVSFDDIFQPEKKYHEMIRKDVIEFVICNEWLKNSDEDIYCPKCRKYGLHFINTGDWD